MKKKIIIAFAALMLFAFSIAAYAYTNHSNHNSTSCCATADCCKDGKCKMNGECCKDKDSCPMNKKDTPKETSGVDMSKVTVVADGDDCCNGGSCCKSGGSCCHKKS